MYRATTPHQVFKFPVEVANFTQILITYSQNKTKIINKTIDDLTLEGNTASFYLTQEETNMFKPCMPVYIQVRVMTEEGQVLASIIYKTLCEKVLNDTIITQEEPQEETQEGGVEVGS